MNWLKSKLSKNKSLKEEMDSFDLSSIENGREMALKLVFKVYRKTTTLLVFLMVILSFGSYLLSGSGQFFIFGLLISILLFTIYLFCIHSLAKEWLMKKFAETNGMNYQKQAPVSSVSGRRFEEGDPAKVYYVISGEYKDHPVRLYKYESAAKKGRHQFKYRFTTFEITFKEVIFPFIFLQPRKHQGPLSLGKNEKEVSLEKPFDEQFRLFVTNQYEIEALQIFTPAFLEFLQEKSFKFNIYFSGKVVCVYTKDYLENKSELQELLDVGYKFFDSVGPLLNRLDDDFRSLHQYY